MFGDKPNIEFTFVQCIAKEGIGEIHNSLSKILCKGASNGECSFSLINIKLSQCLFIRDLLVKNVKSDSFTDLQWYLFPINIFEFSNFL